MTNVALTITLATALLAGVPVAHSEPTQQPQPDSWQMQRLFNPSPNDIDRETHGSVMIYEGMKETTVERAMDKHFDRIEHMMFVGTVITDDQGNPKKDPETGGWITEDDGC